MPGRPAQEGQFQKCGWFKLIAARGRADKQVEEVLLKMRIILCQQWKVNLTSESKALSGLGVLTVKRKKKIVTDNFQHISKQINSAAVP